MKLSKINNLLVGLIILVNGYMIIAPFWPALLFHAQNHNNKRQELLNEVRANKKPPPKTQPNRIVIPSMLLDQPIYDGPSSQQYDVLNKGIWRFSSGSTPDHGGNTVLIGHRFTYTNPRGVFYYLDKVRLGDTIGVWWSNKQYVYKVTRIAQVRPTDTAIEANTAKPELTLFTCTPLWLPKNRLVVVADLEIRP